MANHNEYIIITATFIKGGVENLFITFAQQKVNCKFYLFVLRDAVDDEQIGKLPSNVVYIDCKMTNTLLRFIYYQAYIRFSLKNINTLIDFHEVYISELFMLLFVNNRNIIHWFNINPYMRLKKIYDRIYYKLLPKFDKIVCLCNSQKELIKELSPSIPEYKYIISYNYIKKNEVLHKSNQIKPFEYDYFVMVSRIDFFAKDFSTVVHAYELLSDKIRMRYKLVFVGGGADLPKLQEIVSQSPQAKNIYLVGNQLNPYSWIKNSTILIHSSKTEGFPLVLLEAMSLSVPVICSDCLVAPKEILGDGKYGRLFDIGDYVGLAKNIENLLANDQSDLIKHAIERVDFYIEEGTKSVDDYFDNNFYLEKK